MIARPVAAPGAIEPARPRTSSSRCRSQQPRHLRAPRPRRRAHLGAVLHLPVRDRLRDPPRRVDLPGQAELPRSPPAPRPSAPASPTRRRRATRVSDARSDPRPGSRRAGTRLVASSIGSRNRCLLLGAVGHQRGAGHVDADHEEVAGTSKWRSSSDTTPASMPLSPGRRTRPASAAPPTRLELRCAATPRQLSSWAASSSSVLARNAARRRRPRPGAWPPTQPGRASARTRPRRGVVDVHD